MEVVGWNPTRATKIKIKIVNKVEFKILRKAGYILNPDDDKVNEIIRNLNKNCGHCPTKVKNRNGHDFCPCHLYNADGKCLCGLYLKEEDLKLNVD